MGQTQLQKYSPQERGNKSELDLITVTATSLPPTATFAQHKVIAQSVEIPYAFSVNGGTSMIKSVSVLDEGVHGGTGIGMDIYFTSASDNITEALNKGIGTDIDDLDVVLRSFQGFVSFLTTDYVELVDCDFASKTGIDLVVQGASDSTSLYMHLVNRVGNYTNISATDIKVKIGIMKD